MIHTIFVIVTAWVYTRYPYVKCRINTTFILDCVERTNVGAAKLLFTSAAYGPIHSHTYMCKLQLIIRPVHTPNTG